MNMIIGVNSRTGLWMRNYCIFLLVCVLMTLLFSACAPTPQPTPTATETPLPTQTLTLTITPKPTNTPTITASPTEKPTPTLPADWMNWKGDVKDFSSYITISSLDDLDQIIAYYKKKDTDTYPNPKVCNLKLKLPNRFALAARPDYVRLEYEWALPKECSTKENLPAHNIFAARLPYSNSQGSETLLFIVQKRYTPEGPIYMKYVTVQTFIEHTYKKYQYFKSCYKDLSEEIMLLNPLVEYTQANKIETYMNDYAQTVLKLVGYTYNKVAVKDMLTALLKLSQEDKPIPQELRKKIESTLFFGVFNFW
jgi:hypothetical protein